MHPFFRMLQNNSDLINEYSITYHELCRLLPGFDHVTKVVTHSPVQAQSQYRRGQGERWSAATGEAIACTIMQQSVPAMMTECLMSDVHFMATNDTIGSVDVVQVFGASGFTEGIDLSPFIVHFIERLKREVLSDISKRGLVKYKITVHMGMTTQSQFIISLDNEPDSMFVAPTFCDALYSPVVTTNIQDLFHMSSDLSTMLMNAGNEITNMNRSPTADTPFVIPKIKSNV